MATFQETAGLTITLDGKAWGLENTRDVTGVTKVVEGTITAPNGTFANVLTLTATEGLSTLTTIKDGMLINNSTTVTVKVQSTVTGADQAARELLPGGCMFIHSYNLDGSINAAGFVNFTAPLNTIEISGDGGTAIVSCVFCGT